MAGKYLGGGQNLSLLSVSEKFERKINKYSRFSWLSALFNIKQRSREESGSPNTSGVGPHGWYNGRGCQTLSLLIVSNQK